MIDYKSAWEELNRYVSLNEYDNSSYIVDKMRELEKKYNITDNVKDIKIGDYTFERSRLPKFTKEDFEEAKKAYDQNHILDHILDEMESQISDANLEASKFVDKLIFDELKACYGCKSPQDVYRLMTDYNGIREFADCVKTVNQYLKSTIDPQFVMMSENTYHYNPLCDLQLRVPTKPFEKSDDLFHTIETRWDEIYNHEEEE